MGTALLVVDVQVGVVRENPGSESVVPVVASLVEAARAAGRPVVWVQHDDEGLSVDGDDWQLAPPLSADPAELTVRKQHRSAFGDTGLAQVLRERNVDRIVVTGVQSAYCVDLAGKHALAAGFDLILVSDAHANGPMETEAGPLTDAQVRALVNRTWSTLRHPGCRVEVTSAAEVEW